MMRVLALAGIVMMATTGNGFCQDQSRAPLQATGPGQTPARPLNDRTPVGFTERAMLYPGNLPLFAKMDSGARTSSLNAEDILTFERDGRMWVKFHVTNRDNRTVMFERPVVRRAQIKDLTGPAVSRPVVMLGICVADVFRITEVNLSNRTGFNFQLLVGRRFMRQALLVDPARQNTTTPTCKVTEEALRALDFIPGIPYQKDEGGE